MTDTILQERDPSESMVRVRPFVSSPRPNTPRPGNQAMHEYKYLT